MNEMYLVIICIAVGTLNFGVWKKDTNAALFAFSILMLLGLIAKGVLR